MDPASSEIDGAWEAITSEPGRGLDAAWTEPIAAKFKFARGAAACYRCVRARRPSRAARGSRGTPRRALPRRRAGARPGFAVEGRTRLIGSLGRIAAV